MGRKLTKPRGQQGTRLAALRRDAGLTQTELANAIDETQQTIAYWERSTRPARSDAIPKLARVLGVSVEDLLSDAALQPTQKPTKPGPPGKLDRLFREVARLPRQQQAKVAEFVSAFIEQQKRKAG